MYSDFAYLERVLKYFELLTCKSEKVLKNASKTYNSDLTPIYTLPDMKKFTLPDTNKLYYIIVYLI